MGEIRTIEQHMKARRYSVKGRVGEARLGILVPLKGRGVKEKKTKKYVTGQK